VGRGGGTGFAYINLYWFKIGIVVAVLVHRWVLTFCQRWQCIGPITPFLYWGIGDGPTLCQQRTNHWGNVGIWTISEHLPAKISQPETNEGPTQKCLSGRFHNMLNIYESKQRSAHKGTDSPKQAENEIGVPDHTKKKNQDQKLARNLNL